MICSQTYVYSFESVRYPFPYSKLPLMKLPMYLNENNAPAKTTIPIKNSSQHLGFELKETKSEILPAPWWKYAARLQKSTMVNARPLFYFLRFPGIDKKQQWKFPTLTGYQKWSGDKMRQLPLHKKATCF